MPADRPTAATSSPDPGRRPRRILAGDVRQAWAHLRKEEANSAGRTRPGLWRHGFASYAAALYDLDENDPAEYLSDVAYAVLRRRLGNPTQESLLQNKLAFHAWLHPQFADHLPHLLGHMVRGRVHAWPASADQPRTLLDALDDHEAVVVKPVVGMQGKAVHVLRRGPHGLSLDALNVSVDDVRSFAASLDDHLVQELLTPHRDVSALSEAATSTIRLAWVRDPLSDETMVIGASQRIANEVSAPTDNFSRGALAAGIDLATGVMGRAAAATPDGLAWHDRHPETGAPIAGTRVPAWTEVLDLVEQLGRSLPFLHFIGWDLVVDDRGVVRIIEGNHGLGVRTLQIHTPLLRHAAFRALCQRYRVLGLAPVRDLF